MISLFDRFTFRPAAKGYASFRRLIPENKMSCHEEETRWFWTAGREFGLWYLTVNGFGLHLELIGPFSK